MKINICLIESSLNERQQMTLGQYLSLESLMKVAYPFAGECRLILDDFGAHKGTSPCERIESN